MKIIVLVDPLGNTQTVVRGAVGASCLDASEFVTKNLGVVIDDVLTEEYSMQTIQEENQVGVQNGNINTNYNRQVNRIY